MALTLMFITNDPKTALIADKSGVERIWIDLEVLGKEERQKGMNSVKSKHSVSDIRIIKKILKKSSLLVRINPWNENSINEIEEVIEAGADIIMLPMWKSYNEVDNFIQTINGRVKTVLLLETKEAVDILDQILNIDGIDEIHIGLNDLHLSYGLTFMFELLSNGTVESICKCIQLHDIPYGFGGISHLGDGLIPAEMIIKEHYRLGSTRVILSRGFAKLINKSFDFEENFIRNIHQLRKFEVEVKKLTISELLENKEHVQKSINKIINSIEVIKQ